MAWGDMEGARRGGREERDIDGGGEGGLGTRVGGADYK